MTILPDIKNFTIEDFEDFLRENPQQYYIPKNKCECPIARYLQARLGNASIRTGICWALILDVGNSMILDYNHGWIEDFINDFDDTPSNDLFSLSGEGVLRWLQEWKENYNDNR